MTNHSGNGHPNPGDYWSNGLMNNTNALENNVMRFGSENAIDHSRPEVEEKSEKAPKKSRGGRPSKTRLARIHDSLKHKNAPCEACGQPFQSTLPAQRACNACRASAWSLWQQMDNRKRRRLTKKTS
jgi:hypothetical protein